MAINKKPSAIKQIRKLEQPRRLRKFSNARARVRHLDTRPHGVLSPSLSHSYVDRAAERDANIRRQTLSETLRGLFVAAILYVPFVDRYSFEDLIYDALFLMEHPSTVYIRVLY